MYWLCPLILGLAVPAGAGLVVLADVIGSSTETGVLPLLSSGVYQYFIPLFRVPRGMPSLLSSSPSPF
jgi:hypothetical protein